MTRYHMNDLEPPDEVAAIQQQEEFEETDDYKNAVRNFMLTDGFVFDFACEQFYLTGEYDKAFAEWLTATGWTS